MRGMLHFTAGLLIAGFASSALVAGEPAGLRTQTKSVGPFKATLAAYIAQRIGEFDQIPESRRDELKQIALYVRGGGDGGQTAKLVFICTHNSRRSHMAQIWASAAAAYYRVPRVESFSGGTEGTAFNPRAIAALERAGLSIDKTSDDKNPRYRVRLTDGTPPLVCFSKRYDDDANPKSDFCAVMTCSEADKSCPTVAGSSLRIPLHYEDPKVADGTPQEAAKYDERCAQISREMLYLFAQLSG